MGRCWRAAEMQRSPKPPEDLEINTSNQNRLELVQPGRDNQASLDYTYEVYAQ